MNNPISNHPRGVRGAFVEYSHGPPPLVVPFQFNPVQLQRNRSLDFQGPGDPGEKEVATQDNDKAKSKQTIPDLRGQGLRKLHQKTANLMELHEAQLVTVQEESISLEIRLDATDRIDEGDPVAARLGIAPQLAILEQMVYPRSETALGDILQKLSSASNQRFSYTSGAKPPLILFVWGSRWVLPVNINNMNITESEFNTALYPLRATIGLTLTVIEGPNPLFKVSLHAREALAALGMARVIHVADVVIPG